MWFIALAHAAPDLLGDPAWRAPDGIVDAEVSADGGAWVRSQEGEVTGFDRRGSVLTTFQACPTRSGYSGTAINPKGSRLAVDCGGVVRVYALPSGKEVADIAVHVDGMSFDFSETLGIVGRRVLEERIEDETHFLTYGGDGALRAASTTTWEVPVFTSTGWVGVIGVDGEDPASRPPLTLKSLAGPTLPYWEWSAPEALHSVDTSWRADNSVAVLGGGRLICAAMDHGVICLDSATGAQRSEWSDPRVMLESTGGDLRVGDALWFSKDGALVEWNEGEPKALSATGPVSGLVANLAGSVRFALESSRLVPVDGSGNPLPDTRNHWDTPVSVGLSADGSRMLLLDERERVFLMDVAAGVAEPEGIAQAIALSPSGNAAWMRQGDDSVLVDLIAGRRTSLGEVMVAAFDATDTLYAAVPGRLAKMVASGLETATDLPEWVEQAEGLDLRDRRALVYDEVGYLLAISIDTQTASDRISWDKQSGNDARLTPGAITLAKETDDGDWRVGTTLIPHHERVRIRPDGKGFITMPEDSKHVHLRRHDGSIAERIDLPGRVADGWVFEQWIVLALRDGRLARIAL